jgi:transcriptional regulator with XRE-family HTH domain
LSQQQLADQLHISRQSISKWENGTSLPSISNVIAISDLFDISLDDLIKKDDDLKMKFEKQHSANTLLGIFLLVVPLAIIVMIILGISGANFDTFSSITELIAIIAFICFSFSVNWSKLTKNLTTRDFIFLGIFIIVLVLYTATNGHNGFVDGFQRGVNDYQKFRP